MLPRNLIRLIDLMAGATGRSAGTIGRQAGGSGDFYPRLQKGHDITTRRAARVGQWLSDRWPADLEWPADIERPVPSAEDERGEAA